MIDTTDMGICTKTVRGWVADIGVSLLDPKTRAVDIEARLLAHVPEHGVDASAGAIDLLSKAITSMADDAIEAQIKQVAGQMWIVPQHPAAA